MEVNYLVKTFSELTLDELYDIMVLRQEVFIVEQKCPYLDADGKDKESMHMMAVDPSGALIAYVRILPQGISYSDYASIGRVVNSRQHRGQGIGKEIMIRSIDFLTTNYPKTNIKLSAQCYLLGFYENLGFEKVGKEYLEDDIPHHAMTLSMDN